MSVDRTLWWEPAFPVAPGGPGLTKREYFAACALQGLIAADMITRPDGMTAIEAVKFADALIEALNDRNKEIAP
jgi:hypothetical protein